MPENAWLQMLIYVAVLLALAKPLGAYMARVYEGKPCGLDRALGWLERLTYRWCGIAADAPMAWKSYAGAVLLFSLLGALAVYGLQLAQGYLPLNPEHFGAVAPDLALNTAISFVTNTNWQSYNGETTLSYLTQMLALTVQNFVSASVGMAVLMALIRGIRGRQITNLGNFWVDLTRGILYILMPLSFLLALFLVSQGVVQTWRAYPKVALVQPVRYVPPGEKAAGPAAQRTVWMKHQTLPVGPAASQIAIKQLGTNGGGFFGTNSAHPFENPTPLSNFFEMLAILLIPAALCHTYGRMVGDARQGWAILAAMVVIFVPLMIGCVAAEQIGNPRLSPLYRVPVLSRASRVGQQPTPHWFAARRGYQLSGGNMEGKETRFGVTDSAIWTTATTAASNGSVNSMLDSYTPLGGLVPLWLMELGEIIFGGVGSGLYAMLAFVIVAVFIAGLMVGRTPEYLGKKIDAFEMKMAALVVLIPPALVLLAAAVALVLPSAVAATNNPGAHGYSEILYWASSVGNNNGSAFAGLNTNSFFYNLLGAVAMWISRYWLIVPILAMAGSLGRKNIVPVSSGTLPTHNALFVGWLVATIVIIGALTFLPALALGPVAEYLQMVHG